MNTIQTITATTIAGNLTTVNKQHILAITAPDSGHWITITSVGGDSIQLHPETNYEQLVKEWTS